MARIGKAPLYSHHIELLTIKTNNIGQLRLWFAVLNQILAVSIPRDDTLPDMLFDEGHTVR